MIHYKTMKHIDNYIVLFHQDDEEWESVAIFESASHSNIREQIVRLFIDWCYDEDDENNALIDRITVDLFGDNYYEDDVFKFKIESVPFYK